MQDFVSGRAKEGCAQEGWMPCVEARTQLRRAGLAEKVGGRLPSDRKAGTARPLARQRCITARGLLVHACARAQNAYSSHVLIRRRSHVGSLSAARYLCRIPRMRARGPLGIRDWEWGFKAKKMPDGREVAEEGQERALKPHPNPHAKD